MDDDRTAARRRESARAIHDRLRREAAEERSGRDDAIAVVVDNSKGVLATLKAPFARIWR